MRQVVRNFVSQPSALGSDQPNDDLAAELQSYAICRLLADFVAESVLEGRVGRRGDILGRAEVTVLRQPDAGRAL
jgi:hypothetical protein